MFRNREIVILTSVISFLLLAQPAFGVGSFSIGDKLVVDIINDTILFLLSIIGRIALLMLIFGGKSIARQDLKYILYPTFSRINLNNLLLS